MKLMQWIGGRAIGPRVLAGLVFGLLAGSLILHRGLSIIFLAALFGATALLSVGLGSSRMLVALAIWVGQYSVFYLSVARPAGRSLETEAPLFIVRSFFVFLPGTAIILGGFLGLLAERIHRSPHPRP